MWVRKGVIWSCQQQSVTLPYQLRIQVEAIKYNPLPRQHVAIIVSTKLKTGTLPHGPDAVSTKLEINKHTVYLQQDQRVGYVKVHCPTHQVYPHSQAFLIFCYSVSILHESGRRVINGEGLVSCIT